MYPLKITNQMFIKNGVRMTRCWDIGKGKDGQLIQVMTEVPSLSPSKTVVDHTWRPHGKDSTFSDRANTAGNTP